MDQLDQAQRYEEMEREAALTRREPVPFLTGFCQNDCGESTEGAFCSKECRSDFNQRMRMRG